MLREGMMPNTNFPIEQVGEIEARSNQEVRLTNIINNKMVGNRRYRLIYLASFLFSWGLRAADLVGTVGRQTIVVTIRSAATPTRTAAPLEDVVRMDSSAAHKADVVLQPANVVVATAVPLVSNHYIIQTS